MKSARAITKAKVRGDVIQTERLSMQQSLDNEALVATPSKRKYSQFIQDMDRTYVIHVEGSDVHLDLYLAKEFSKVKEVKYLN